MIRKKIFFNGSMIFIIIIILSVCGCYSEKEYSYNLKIYGNIAENNKSNDIFFILVPIRDSYKINNGTLREKFNCDNDSTSAVISIENNNGSYFYNISCNNSFKLEIKKYFNKESSLETYKNEIPFFNHKYSPTGNISRDTIFVFFHSNDNNSLLFFKIELIIEKSTHFHLLIEGNIKNGWNKMEFHALNTT